MAVSPQNEGGRVDKFMAKREMDVSKCCFVPLFSNMLIWLLVIVFAPVWIIWNIQGRVVYFLSRPSAITTEMKFKDKIMFPKVTICNQNMFRSSKVYNETIGPRTSASLYETTDRYLQVVQDNTARQNVSEKYLELLSDKNVEEFYRRVAHQKNTGKDGGLDLMLFVEQYDYMRGDQTSAGALVVITAHSETEALAKEQGIGVKVGHSISVGLQKSEVIKLPHPHGSCGTAELDNYPPDVPYTYQKCQLNCLTSFIKRKCGCFSVYMPGKGTAYCTLLEDLQCVRPNEELFYISNQIRTCDCRIPCHSASYMVSLSLVQFSDSFKRSLALYNSLVHTTTVETALKIQVWGLLNTVNSSITESLADMGLMLIEYKNRWNRLSSIIHSHVEEVKYLMDFVSEHNLKSHVVAELQSEQEADTTWKRLQLAVVKIHKSVVFCDELLSIYNHLELKSLDYAMAVSGLRNALKKKKQAG
ncbi:acid-sensing ion channel 1-like [Gigantopelta aegis]|uniref:acid-sensing ion channel 1-like n=1 Tax=Gigantopelta aegis TaxID=1735272 RepID=UPI001B88C7F7|nr:acid-sensing ion channel 1-like [Gigantopelta aegis]